jgi:hypothetical protein
MIIDSWIIFAALATLGKAITALVNEFFQVRAIHLLFWMRLICTVILLCFVGMFDVPTDLAFYGYLFFASLLIPYADILYITLTAKSGAGVVTRILPLFVVVMFVMWLPFSPDLVMEYIRNPIRTLGILLSIGGCVFLSMRLKSCDVSFGALKSMMPAIFLWSLATVLGKFAIGRVDGPENIYYYLLIQCVVVLVFYAAMLRFKFFKSDALHMDLESNLLDKKVIQAGVVFGVLWLATTGLRWLAIDDVENPAYVSTIGLASPLLVMLVYKIVGRKETVNVKAGLGIVLCAGLLIFVTQIL